MGPIPVSRIRDYAERSGLEPDTTRLLTTMVRALDRAYMKWTQDERSKAGA